MRLRMLAVAALPLALLAAPGPAQAEPPLCHGLAATLVGTVGGDVTGTEGPDVIVTADAVDVRALGGDDTICVTGTTYDPSVDAGAGNDYVEALLPKSGADTDLGAGDDVFVGGSGQNGVEAGDHASSLPLGHDVITTEGGSDYVVSGVPGQVNDDVISLGAGYDELTLSGTVTGQIAGDDGRDTLILRDPARVARTIDNRIGQLTVGSGAPTDFASFERFDLTGLHWSRLMFYGGPGKETVDAARPYRPETADGPVRASMGGGDDVLQVREEAGGPWVGARGDDLLVVRGSGPLVTADLAADRVRFGRLGSGRAASASAVGFEDLTTWGFHRAVVRGDDGDNKIIVLGCSGLVHGLGGDDRIDTDVQKSCDPVSDAAGLTAYGDAGDDRLFGDIRRDTLVGGPGLDRADGWTGRDRCLAERERRCES